MKDGELYRRDGTRIMSGRYPSTSASREWLGRDNAKENDRFLTLLRALENTPIEQWPEDARQYPIDDATNTLLVAEAQPQVSEEPVRSSAQCHAAFTRFTWARCGACVLMLARWLP